MPLIRNIGKAVIGRRSARSRSPRGLLGVGLGIVATRIATRSIPGAVLVGGALMAKKLYQRRKLATNSRP